MITEVCVSHKHISKYNQDGTIGLPKPEAIWLVVDGMQFVNERTRVQSEELA